MTLMDNGERERLGRFDEDVIGKSIEEQRIEMINKRVEQCLRK